MKTTAKERVLQHWVTTIIGMAILCLSAYYFFINVKDNTLTFENIAIGFFLGFVGVFFLLAKDTWFNKIFGIFSDKLGK